MFPTIHGIASGQGSDSVTVDPAPEYIIRDTFTGPNGTNLTARSPDIDTVGGGWTAANGTIQIQSNRAQSVDTNTQKQYVIDAGVADVVVEAAITAAHATANTPGLLIRYVNDSNKVHVRWSGTTGALEIYEWISGSATLRDSESVPGLGANDEFTLTVEVVGTTITATLTFDGNDYVASYGSLSNTTATKVGLRDINSDHASTWDNFSVYAA